MKNSILILALLLNVFVSKSQISVGHRDQLNQPVLDINPVVFQPLVQESFSKFQNVSIANIELSDNPLVEGYLPSLIITVSFSEPENSASKLGVSLQYMLNYDKVNNRYGGIEQEPIAVGPKQCLFENCVGCRAVKNEKGKIVDCSPCTPTNTTASYFCKIGREGTVEVIEALTGLLSALTGLLGVL
jgi:hypothetical protein